ncbi:proline-rich receptor-like protein kinase PERK10 [Zingiber officinale]|uniref:proline-rich receptor-like protein kinase PERK10 n=1 Tax=Zingiber officinale TaxID=94328 RepID=UPI001C4C318B|nr:proline-rich receptor-like protein kinase PERK10 [Zingiber officinale]
MVRRRHREKRGAFPPSQVPRRRRGRPPAVTSAPPLLPLMLNSSPERSTHLSSSSSIATPSPEPTPAAPAFLLSLSFSLQPPVETGRAYPPSLLSSSHSRRRRSSSSSFFYSRRRRQTPLLPLLFAAPPPRLLLATLPPAERRLSSPSLRRHWQNTASSPPRCVAGAAAEPPPFPRSWTSLPRPGQNHPLSPGPYAAASPVGSHQAPRPCLPAPPSTRRTSMRCSESDQQPPRANSPRVGRPYVDFVPALIPSRCVGFQPLCIVERH